MIDRTGIQALLPHQGTMCLLDSVRSWSAAAITATARSHLDADNPLRRAGQLSMVCGAEYAFQAAALHGALRAGGVAQPQGYVAGLRLDAIGGPRLDDAAYGLLMIETMLEFDDPSGMIYGFRLLSEGGGLLLAGRGTIIFPGVLPRQ
ncbi:phosphotransferase [Lichenicoccus sp.]|uniref:phosphotransferase n=1 Tax=Lichenicoccus sp. TaxID=2781899 RepID=UPI003D112F84